MSTAPKTSDNARENIYRREAKLLLLTEIRATAAPLAAWGVIISDVYMLSVISWLSDVNKIWRRERSVVRLAVVTMREATTRCRFSGFLMIRKGMTV